MSKLFQASIKENKKLTENHYILTLHPLEKIIELRPGQFFMLAVDKSLDPLLKRPFSLHRKRGKNFQILYRVVGKATAILKEKRAGDTIEVLGPLGNGFPRTKSKIMPILVAGGIGVAPLFALAETIADKKPLFFLGAKNKKEILGADELKSIGIKPIIATDDGSMGGKGTVIDVLNNFFTSSCTVSGAGSHFSLLPAPFLVQGLTSHLLYACGPKPMLRELAFLAKKFNIDVYAAFEENMACGIGACLSCVINTKDGFKRICKEGPVFPLEEIIW